MGAGDGKLHVSFMNVGQGDCTYIVMPNGQTALIDCGSSNWSNTNRAEFCTAFQEFKTNGNSGRINLLILTHRDRDHYEQVGYIVGGALVDLLVHSDDFAFYTNQTFRDWFDWHARVRQVQSITVNASSPKPIQPLVLLNGTSDPNMPCVLSCYASNVAATSSHDSSWVNNTVSVVTRIDYGSDSVMMCADATMDTENFILTNFPGQIKSPVVRVGHHGSLTSSTAPFVTATNPQIAVVSVGAWNSYGLPRQSVLLRWLAVTQPTATAHNLGYYTDFGGGQANGAPLADSVSKETWETCVSGSFQYTFDGKPSVPSNGR